MTDTVRGMGLVQRHLDGLYRTGLRAGVEQFVIGEKTRAALIEAGAIESRESAREEVYVLCAGGEMELAIFVDDKALRAVERVATNGELRLDDTEFNDFCVALEAVSHFLLLAHRARQETPVTQLELELQAEVDKYLAARLLAWRQDNGPLPDAIARKLFWDFHLDNGLTTEQRQRYVTANRLAMRYCDFLERSFIRERRLFSLMRELGRFFRQGQQARLETIGG
jgi:hypothetical protein